MRVRFAFDFAADFADLFEIRGYLRSRRGAVTAEQRGPAEMAFIYRSLDDVPRSTRITFDVVPSGTQGSPPDHGELAALLRTDIARLSRRYDTIVTVMSNEQAVGGLSGEMPTAKLVYCVRLGDTRVADLRKAIETIKLAGIQLLGLVVWGTDTPVLTAGESTEATRAERKQLVTSRA
jgi:hypothetical protein